MGDIARALPTDANNRRFAGPMGYLPAGRRVGSTDYAVTAVEGYDAHDAVSTSQPLQIGGVAESTFPTAVADGDAVRAWFDTFGRLVATLKHTDGTALTDASGVKVQTADGAQVTIGAKADAKSTATDTTPISSMSIWKQISASVQAIATSVAGTLAASISSVVPGTAATNLGKAEDAAHTSGDTGVMMLAVRQNVPAALATTDADYAPPEVDSLGSLWVRQQAIAAVSADVALASAATSAQVLAANTARRGLLLTNTDANDCYVYYGTTATAAKFTVKIPPGGYWEMPVPPFQGRIDAIWSADGSGSLIGSEL